MTQYYVATTGNDANPGTQSQPFLTIQKGANVAHAGDTVHVAPGTYAGIVSNYNNGVQGSPVTFISDTPWGAKVVGNSSNQAWFQGANYVVIQGFDITTTTGALGINNAGSFCTIKGCYVHDIGTATCAGSGGAGIDSTNYSGSDNDIIGNLVVNVGPQTLCSTTHGIYHSNLRGHIQNNIIVNVSGFGIHMWHAANNVNVYNNLIINARYGGVMVGDGDAPGGVTNDYTFVSNNIILNCTNWGIRELGATGTNNQYNNNCIYNCSIAPFSLQNGNVDHGTLLVNPLLVNPQLDGSGDYHLTGGSPCRDAGYGPYAPTTDFDGNLRPAISAIGPYQYVSILEKLMAKYSRQQVANNATITTVGALGNNIADLGRSLNPTVIVLVTVGSVSGASPSLTLNYGVSVDSLNYAPKHAVGTTDNTPITAAGSYLYEFHDVIEPYLNVSVGAVSGTFSGVNIDILFTGTDG